MEFYNLDKLIKVKVFDKCIQDWGDKIVFKKEYKPTWAQRFFFGRKHVKRGFYWWQPLGEDSFISESKSCLPKTKQVDENNFVWDKPEVIFYFPGELDKSIYFDKFEEAKKYAEEVKQKLNLKDLENDL